MKTDVTQRLKLEQETQPRPNCNQQVPYRDGPTGFGPVTCVLRQGVLNGDEILQRLGHLAAGDRQVSGVQEVSDPVIVLKESLRGTRP